LAKLSLAYNLAFIEEEHQLNYQRNINSIEVLAFRTNRLTQIYHQ